ncbi:hypothetical protein [Krasilnikovia cinnamomea]|nr:hypothetical protein [Krasilnikovia cinnamomea]
MVALLIGVATDRLAESAVGFLAGGAVLVLTMIMTAGMSRIPAIVTSAVGGLVALHAATVSFVLVGFSPHAAPREHAPRWWTAAATGLFHDNELGAAISDSELPLWVQLSRATGPLLVLLTVTIGFALAYLVRCRARAGATPLA